MRSARLETVLESTQVLAIGLVNRKPKVHLPLTVVLDVHGSHKSSFQLFSGLCQTPVFRFCLLPFHVHSIRHRTTGYCVTDSSDCACEDLNEIFYSIIHKTEQSTNRFTKLCTCHWQSCKRKAVITVTDLDWWFMVRFCIGTSAKRLRPNSPKE